MARKQIPIFPPESDPKIVQIADRLIEIINDLEANKHKREVAEEYLIGYMKSAGKTQVRHGGRVFEIKETPSKEKIKVKPDKYAEA
jgi:hypothetical protein